MSSTLPAWSWIAIALAAAAAQTVRNAAQRALVAQAGTLGATLARFLYGIPFAAALVAVLHAVPATAASIPDFSARYAAWLLLGAVSQIAATACLLAAMKQRNFVVGVAYSKTDALQVAIASAVLLHEWPTLAMLAAIALATAGVLALSWPTKPLDGGVRAWAGGAAAWGLASGAGFALSAVGYRGAALALGDGTPAWMAGAWGVLFAQIAQTLLLGGWMAWRAPEGLRAIAKAWRVSIAAGAMGALASAGWFTGFALTSAANVRTVGLAEVLFSYAVSRRFLRESLSRLETLGLVLVVTGVAVVVASGAH